MRRSANISPCGRYRYDLTRLGTNKDGTPKHPLYLKGDTKLEVFL